MSDVIAVPQAKPVQPALRYLRVIPGMLLLAAIGYAGKLLEQMIQRRTPCQADHRLGNVPRRLAQPRAAAAAQYHRLMDLHARCRGSEEPGQGRY